MQAALAPRFWENAGHWIDGDFPFGDPALAGLYFECALRPWLGETAIAKLFEHPVSGRERYVRGFGAGCAAVPDPTIIAGASLAAVVMNLAHVYENRPRRRPQVGPVLVHEQGPGDHDEPLARFPAA